MGSHVLPALSDNPEDLDHPWWLVALRHASDLALAGYSVAIGGVTLAQVIQGAAFNAGPLEHMPIALAAIIASCVTVGGLLAAVGALLRIDNLKLELGIEMAGWFIMFSGWAAYVAGAHGYSEIDGRVAATAVIAFGALAKVAALIIHQYLLRRRQIQHEKVTRLIERMEDDHG